MRGDVGGDGEDLEWRKRRKELAVWQLPSQGEERRKKEVFKRQGCSCEEKQKSVAGWARF